jgi:hypothetical protein
MHVVGRSVGQFVGGWKWSTWTGGRGEAAVERRGGHFWLFRHPTLADVYLEFRERARPAGPPDDAPAYPELVHAEQRLLEIAEYTPDAEVLWEEIPLKER